MKLGERGTKKLLAQYGLSEAFPRISKTAARRAIRGKSDLVFANVKKGSWEIALVGAIGGFLVKAMYDLGADAFKESPSYERLKNILTSQISGPTAKAVESQLNQKMELGPLIVARKELEIIQNPDGTCVVKYRAELETRGEELYKRQTASNDEQLRALAAELEKRGSRDK